MTTEAQTKISYMVPTGGQSTAYVDIVGNVATGTDKHTDEPMKAVYRGPEMGWIGTNDL